MVQRRQQRAAPATKTKTSRVRATTSPSASVKALAGSTARSSAPRAKAKPITAKVVHESQRIRAAQLVVDPRGPHVGEDAFVRAEQCIALLQRRLIKPMSRGGPRGDLTMTQYHALSFLAARGQASVTELKEMLGVAQSTTSVLVDKLARLGLVEKQRDRRDHRLTCVVPLPKGLRMVQRYRKNAERNLLGLAAVLGESAVRDVFQALEQAIVATTPLEDARVARAVAETRQYDGDQSDDDDDDEALAAE